MKSKSAKKNHVKSKNKQPKYIPEKVKGFDEIYAELEFLLKDKPPVEQAYMLQNLGITAKRIGKFDKALELQKRAISLVPTNGSAYYNVGKLLYITGEYEASARSYILAKRYNATVLNESDIYLHYGHAIIDPQNLAKGINKPIIEYYKSSISGVIRSAPSLNMADYAKYNNQCLQYGIEHLNKELEKLK